MREIRLTEADFREISTDVAADLLMEAERHGVKPTIIGLITAMFCARLDDALFKDDELEVE